ncbi:hypothetical protein RESH_01167 [Rhodopirellula europaea SH398]|uniref:Uncharacterized protein n=1 Tax=Rhodopirellula europaea SH398 TaxID=1263868 RepID=M5S9P2_9BACT|nr:hypothetical protein RESH_01167 [Rhodopirellula europaea SH398]
MLSVRRFKHQVKTNHIDVHSSALAKADMLAIKVPATPPAERVVLRQTTMGFVASSVR